MSIAFTKDRQKQVILMLLLVIMVLGVYWPVQNFEFVNYDDQLYITENYRIQTPVTSKSILDAFMDIHTGNWHPLTMLSHLLDWQLFGVNAGGHHWTSLIIHVFNTVLLFLLFQILTGALWRSAFIAALFAIHPINMESVAWIAERKNVLSTFFWILTMLCYVWYVKAPGWTRYLTVLICFIFGLMCKPMLVTLPFVLLLLDFWPLNRMTILAGQNQSAGSVQKARTSFLILEKIPLLMVSAFFIGITIYTQKIGNVFYNPHELPLFDRLANIVFSYGLYIKKLFFPTDLSVFYPFHPIPVWQVVLVLFILISATIMACKYFKKYPYLIVGWFWYLGTLIPVIGFIQVGRQSMADRYAYVPFIGLFIILAWTVPQIFAKLRYSKIYASILAIGFIVILMISSYSRVSIWQNTRTLFEDALKINSTNYFAYNVLGVEEANLGRNGKALSYYYVSLKMNPQYEQAYNNAGNAFLKLGKHQDAYNCYQKAISINSKLAIAYHNIGVLFAINNKADEAVINFEKALKITPDDINTHMSMGNLLLSKGNLEDAMLHFEKVINLNPRNTESRKRLGQILNMKR